MCQSRGWAGLRRLLAIGVCVIGAAAATPSIASATPPSVPAYYIYGTSDAAVANAAYNDGCNFARANAGGNRVLMLDFGAARASSAGGGTLDFSQYYVSNPAILTALESASNGVSNCYSGGYNIIVYGNNNSDLSGMTTTDATNAGVWQAQRANDLFNYESSNNRNQQDTGVGIDMEPSFGARPISNDIVNGMNQGLAQAGYDFGSADGCPTSGSGGSCNNGWTPFDVGWASFSGAMLPLPEIYYPVNANQWSVVKNAWNAQESIKYFFAGSTGESSGAGLTPQQGWNDLSAANPGIVDSSPGIICFGC